MKSILIIIAMLLSSVVLQAQKVDVKNNKILVDKEEIATIEEVRRSFGALCTYYIRNSEGKTLITVLVLDYYDRNERNQVDPTGRVIYFRLSFADEKGVAEIPYTARDAKGVAEIIVRAKLIKDNELDDYEVRQFIQAHGTRYYGRQTQSNTIY